MLTLQHAYSLALWLLLSYGIQSPPGPKPGQNQTPQTSTTSISNNDQSMFATILVYLHDNQEKTYQNYIRQAQPLFAKHGIILERAIKPLQVARGSMEVPHEILFFELGSANAFQQLNNDPTYQQLAVNVRDKAISKSIFIPSKASDFAFTREVGTKEKTFGIAFLNYADGKKAQFDDYHDKACEIIPEFGAHFEGTFQTAPLAVDLEALRNPLEVPEVVKYAPFDSLFVQGINVLGSRCRS